MAVASRGKAGLMAEEQRLQLTPRQRELLGWFDRNAQSLREAYEAAIRLLSVPGFPARAHLIGHLVREIANRLSDVIEGTTFKRVDYESSLNNIVPLWQKHFHPRPDYSETAGPDTAPTGVLPSQLKKQIEKLVLEHKEAQSRPAGERLFRSELSDEVDTPEWLKPMEEQFQKNVHWFMSKTHLPAKVTEAVSESELVHKFELFERALFALKGQFFKSIGELDEILQDTNN
jgi:hypothetical protein